ncbi:MAG: hypothetical protein E6K80_12795 [Candidatus Eisenbacteria bacterium]|uniref:Protein kinase domain-containing protein n=1 Tax=Eiseniibacteriota bacterium TaxID=2212470 RepID=A0A538TZN1_UNCEI|nr:MAG: hypothetical protein E6K80_12795 [Candidatus Eisenbacteria bacterium]
MSAPLKIGGYPIERELGRGGMGIVYLARDPKLGRPVAIKVLPEAFADDPERIARFQREAQLLAALHHPNIAGIYGLEEADDRRFLSLQYVEGPTLAERIARGPLPIDEALDVARQTAAALEAAHEAGIIHRDLKPGNVKLTPAGDVKVLDFGLAKGAGSAESNPDLSQSPTVAFAATGVGVILGTAAYMSPEQARGKVVDRRTDIWSFGCVLYEMLTGNQLFSGETATDTIAKILEREPDWSALPEKTPEKVRELLRRCLEKDPRKRLRDIGDARLELEESLARDAKRSSVSAPAPAAPVRKGLPPLAWVAAIAFLAAFGMAGLLAMNRPERGPAMRLTVAEPQGASVSGDGAECAISPDGRTLVFVAADSGGTVQLWQRPLDKLGGDPIAGTENGLKPFWAPDSRWIGFFANGKLKKVRPGGGVEDLCSAPTPRGGTWSPKGTIVFAPAGEGPLFAVSAMGGDPRQVTALDSARHEVAHRFPWFLPDGKHFLYVALPGGPHGFQVMVGSLDGSRGRPIMTVDGAPAYEGGYLVFLRDRNLAVQRFDPGSLRLQGEPVTLADFPSGSQSTGYRAATLSSTGAMAYVNGATTNSRLMWFDRAGHELGAVPIPSAQYLLPILSPDERMVAVDRVVSANEQDVWIVDLERAVITRFTYGPQLNSVGLWSRDGSRIAFESNRSGLFDIYVKPVSGATPEKVLVQGGSQFKHPASWSPNGRTLAFYQLDQGTGFYIWLVPADGSGPPVPYLQTRFHEQNPDISPDGHWLLYTYDESGRPEVYVQSFPTPGHKYQLTTSGCFLGRWRGDGKELVLIGLDGQNVSSASVLESGETFRASPPRLLFRTPPNVNGIAETRDGQRFLAPVPEGKSAATAITVVLNWKSALAADRP